MNAFNNCRSFIKQTITMDTDNNNNKRQKTSDNQNEQQQTTTNWFLNLFSTIPSWISNTIIGKKRLTPEEIETQQHLSQVIEISKLLYNNDNNITLLQTHLEYFKLNSRLLFKLDIEEQARFFNSLNTILKWSSERTQYESCFNTTISCYTEVAVWNAFPSSIYLSPFFFIELCNIVVLHIPKCIDLIIAVIEKSDFKDKLRILETTGIINAFKHCVEQDNALSLTDSLQISQMIMYFVANLDRCDGDLGNTISTISIVNLQVMIENGLFSMFISGKLALFYGSPILHQKEEEIYSNFFQSSNYVPGDATDFLLKIINHLEFIDKLDNGIIPGNHFYRWLKENKVGKFISISLTSMETVNEAWFGDIIARWQQCVAHVMIIFIRIFQYLGGLRSIEALDFVNEFMEVFGGKEALHDIIKIYKTIYSFAKQGYETDEVKCNSNQETLDALEHGWTWDDLFNNSSTTTNNNILNTPEIILQKLNKCLIAWTDDYDFQETVFDRDVSWLISLGKIVISILQESNNVDKLLHLKSGKSASVVV
jgi:hypothetical protein